MSDYSRNRVSGQTYFFTVRLADPRASLLTEHISAFGEAIRLARIKRPFHVDAWVALPNHAHAIWTLPPGDDDCASRWRLVKIAFSKSVRKARKMAVSAGPLWQRHYQLQPIGSPEAYNQAIDRLHANPVRHGMCQTPGDWPWSSYHRFLADGLIVPSEPLDVLPLQHHPTPPRNVPWP